MKRVLLLCSLTVAVPVALAQAPAKPAPKVEAPAHKCEPRPEYPGRLGMTIESRRKQFDRELKMYQECMHAYVDERKAVMKAHEVAAQAAIDEYNGHMKKLRDERDAETK